MDVSHLFDSGFTGFTLTPLGVWFYATLSRVDVCDHHRTILSFLKGKFHPGPSRDAVVKRETG